MILVELLNLTFDPVLGRKWDSNVKFAPLGMERRANLLAPAIQLLIKHRVAKLVDDLARLDE